MRTDLLLREQSYTMMESLILAQNERWRRVLSMQVERYARCLHCAESGELVSNT